MKLYIVTIQPLFKRKVELKMLVKTIDIMAVAINVFSVLLIAVVQTRNALFILL